MFYSRVVISLETLQVIEKDEFPWSGEVAMCKGATDQMKSTAASQQAFMTQLQGNYASQFAGQSSILASLQQAFAPILSAGVGQYGFTPQEDAVLRTQADTGTATAYRNARAAAGENLAAIGGGNAFLPSSTKAGIMAGLANSAASQQSQQQLDITRAGYDTGRQNFFEANNALSGVAREMNPLGFSGAATSAGNSAFGSEEAIQQANAASSPWSTIGGIIGGGLSAFAGGYGTGLGKKAGGP